MTNISETAGISKSAFIHSSSFVDGQVQIGERSNIWHFSHVMPGAKIGSDCILGQNVMIGPNVCIGNRCKIQNNVSIYNGVKLEDNVFCGPSCVFTNVLNPRGHIEKKSEFKSTLVQTGASIGANATIVCGNTLGQYCLIGAGAVVTCDVPDYALVLGVPGKIVGWVSRLGERLSDDLVCPITKEKYIRISDKKIKLAENDRS